jgi:hypothetical protein
MAGERNPNRTEYHSTGSVGRGCSSTKQGEEGIVVVGLDRRQTEVGSGSATSVAMTVLPRGVTHWRKVVAG